MKKNYYLILFFLFPIQFLSAQNHSSAEIAKKYEIKSSFDKADDFFISSFEKADWDKYRYEDKRRVLRFKNGVVIELLSATELIKLNIPFDENRIISKGIQSKSDSKFTINENGHIIELHTYNIKK
jgi:hypothetical protein